MANFFEFLYSSLLLLAPMLLLGLFLSGLIHVFISPRAVLRWLKDDSLKSVSTSAAVGVPIPLCSCSVVPVVAEMRRKGASRSSCMSFLITAPETGADSILVTNAFFGPIVAIIRPVISFLTAVVAGIFCIGLIRDDQDQKKGGDAPTCGHGHDHDHDHSHAHHKSLVPGSDDCYVSPSILKKLTLNWLKGITNIASKWRMATWVKPDFYREKINTESTASQESSGHEHELDFKKIIKHIFRYGFVEVADDILFSLLVGLFLGALLFLVIPSDLMGHEYARWISYPIMILVGIPLYICASATTPVAAALMARGFSPGAALIFLMTGPATNTATIAIIAGQFGKRFTTIYISVVIVVTAILGIIIDALLLYSGITIPVHLNASDSPTIQALQWGGTILLVALIIWRFRAGAFRTGHQDLLSNLRPWLTGWNKRWQLLTRNRPVTGMFSIKTPMGVALYIIMFICFLTSGFTVVPPGHMGYGRLFGKVYWKDLPPGLHYLAPRPFAQIDKWPVREVKSIMAQNSYEYVSGDLNLLTLSISMQYRVKDPYIYYYQTTNPQQILQDVMRNHLRQFVSARSFDKLINIHRTELEKHMKDLFSFDHHLQANPLLRSIELIKINLLNLSPVAEAMPAFREVSSAQEDRERIIINAQRFMVSLVPRAHGNAFYETEQAKGASFRKMITAKAEAQALSSVSDAMKTAPNVLRNMLWREKLETALTDNSKIIIPTSKSLEKVSLWKKKSSGSGRSKHNNYHRSKNK